MLSYKIYKHNSSSKYLLFLHCICGNSNIFTSNINYLKKYFNIITIDLPHHGNSMNYSDTLDIKNIVNNIILILDNNDIDKIYLCGLSLGGCISEYISFFYPNRVEKMILIGVANGLSNTILEYGFKLFTKISYLIPRSLYLRIFNYLVIPQKNNNNIRKQFYNNAKRMNKVALINWLKYLSTHFFNYNTYLCEYLNNLNIPKLYIIGKKDYIFYKKVKRSTITNQYSSLIILEKSRSSL